MDMVANGISDPETIDKAWTLGTGAPKGPFQIMDTVGLVTAKNIVEQYQKVPNLLDPLLRKMMLPYNFDGMLKILNQYIIIFYVNFQLFYRKLLVLSKITINF